MADDIDLANDRVLTETSALIAAASADLPVGSSTATAHPAGKSTSSHDPIRPTPHL